MKALITGGQGFIGSHLSRELADHGHEVAVADVKHEPLLEDVRRPENMERAVLEHEPGLVVHLAARVGRLFGEDDVYETIVDNAAMTATVAGVCGQFGVKLVYASTSEAYGDTGSISGVGIDGDIDCMVRPDVEWASGSERRLIPHNIYGLSKRWGEEACRLYAPDDLTILRFSMPYGPGLPWGRGRAAIVNFIHQAITGQPIPVHLGSERSWCWIGDTVRAVRMILEEDATGAFNVGRDDNACPLLDVARLACDLVGASRGLIEEVPAPGRQTVVKRLATDRIRALGWEPEVDLLEGMENVRDWILAEMASQADPVVS
jgi:nucleoside-diphosphate-sugar epimerase